MHRSCQASILCTAPSPALDRPLHSPAPCSRPSPALIRSLSMHSGPWLDGESVFNLMRDYRVTFSVGVPTVWMNLLAYMEANGLRPSAALKSVCIGGSAAPRSMIDAFEIKYG